MSSRTKSASTPAATASRSGAPTKTRKRPPTKGLIVGIGASAGGLEAFKAFFSHMPADSALAFVLVQHLAPDHPSLLAELVGRSTTMPVLEAAQGMRVEPRHVYVIPPNATLTIADGVLQVSKPAPPREHRWPRIRATARYAWCSPAPAATERRVCAPSRITAGSPWRNPVSTTKR